MVVAEKVNEAVDKETVDFSIDGMPFLPGLAGSNRNGDDDVSEHIGLDRGEPTLPKRERQHISRSVFAPVSAVEGLHRLITDEQNTQFGVRKADTE